MLTLIRQNTAGKKALVMQAVLPLTDRGRRGSFSCLKGAQTFTSEDMTIKRVCDFLIKGDKEKKN